MHILQLNYKFTGSYALRCGCSQFGFKIVGYEAPLVQMVFIFNRRDKRDNFAGWLRSAGLVFNSDYSSQHRYHKGRFIYLIFLSSALFYNYKPGTAKLGDLNLRKFLYKNFAQFCRQTDAQLYKSEQKHLYHH
jgi:hypothetical protein